MFDNLLQSILYIGLFPIFLVAIPILLHIGFFKIIEQIYEFQKNLRNKNERC